MTNQNNKFTAKFSITFIVIILAVVFGGYIVIKLDAQPRTDDAYAYADTIYITPEVSGRIVDMPVTDNMSVKKGDILIKIDDRIYIQQLEKAKAELNSLEKQIELAQKGIDAQTFGAKASDNAVKQARIAREQAQIDFNRIKPLRDSGVASGAQFDKAKNALRIAEEQEKTATFSAKSAEAGISTLDALEAKLDSIRADVALAQLQLDFTTIYAPFDGKILGLRTAIGQFAIAGSPIFTIAKTDVWYVFANFRETDLKAINKDSKATVYLMSNTNKKFSAVLDSIGYGVNPDDGGVMINGLPSVKKSINWVRVAQRFPVRFRILNPDDEMFRIGASAVVVVGK